jgi:hypothetical protein
MSFIEQLEDYGNRRRNYFIIAVKINWGEAKITLVSGDKNIGGLTHDRKY